MPRKAEPDEASDTTLVTVRIPVADLEALRMAAVVRGGSIAHEIRSGVQLRLSQLRRDPDFVRRLREQRDALTQFMDELDAELTVEPAEEAPSSVTSSA